MLRDWALTKLAAVSENPRVIVRDGLRLLPEADGAIHSFAREHGYTVIVAATNLAFRDLYERAMADPETRKLLVIDRAPLRRRTTPSLMKAPPPFYPDLLASTPQEARIDLDLRQYLRDTTGDHNWPGEANEPRYARLIVKHLPAVLRAHQNLRTADARRFTDHDFRTIVAFAALGVAEAAFKKLDAEDYWRIGLLGHDVLAELDLLAPTVTRPIREELRQAPAPFCWFTERDPDTVIRAFYLSVILAQHLENWSLLLAHVDPALAPLASMSTDVLRDAAPKLVCLHPDQAQRDLAAVEQSLSRETLQFLLLDQMHLTESTSFAAVLENEHYSTLVRSLALLLALDDCLAGHPTPEAHMRIAVALGLNGDATREQAFAERRPSVQWSHVKEAYTLACTLQSVRSELAQGIRTLKVMQTKQLTFTFFRELWNDKQLNRLEYYLSALERRLDSGDFLPRAAGDLPAVFGEALARVRQRIRTIMEDVHQHLDIMNHRFQDMVAVQYPLWIEANGASLPHFPVLTSQFLRRCVKPYWDPQHEKAVVLIFDGMRYDVWEALLKPMIEERMEIIADLPASPLLPSETEISRWALAAGAEPAQFWPRKAENVHLQEALGREFNYQGEVEAVAPEGSGTGETVRYRAGNLEYYIFEFCDKELHGIQMKTLPDGRQVPSRPLAFIYEQHLKNLIDTEIMAIVRRLTPGTKVFVTSDHGFGPVGRKPLWFNEADLNEKSDCSYLNCWLRVPIEQADLPAKVRHNVIAFTPDQLRIPREESRVIRGSGETFHKTYQTILFPRVGYSFSRQGSRYHPDAYTHGGISVQEFMIPMIALRVKAGHEEVLTLGSITGPAEVVEGEEIEFRLRLSRTGQSRVGSEDLRLEVEASYSREPDRFPLPRQVLYVSEQGAEVVYHFRPDPADATAEEQRQGEMERLLTIAVCYREGRQTIRKSQTHRFTMRLNAARIVRRVPAHLGNILGLTPKSMR